METIFLFCYDYFKKRRTLLYSILAALFLLLGLGAASITIEEDISKFFPTNKKLAKVNQVFQGSKFAERLVVMVSLKDSASRPEPEKLIAFTDSLVAQMKREVSPYVKGINYRADDEAALAMLGFIGQHLPVFLNENDFNEIDALTRPGAIKVTLANKYRQLVSPAGVAMKKMIVKDPLGVSSIVLRKLQGLQYNDDFELYDNYFFTRDHTCLLFFVTPNFSTNDTGNNSTFLEKLDDVIRQTTVQQPGVTAAYFGAVAVAAGNAQQLRQDTILTVALMTVLMVIFLYGFLRK